MSIYLIVAAEIVANCEFRLSYKGGGNSHKAPNQANVTYQSPFVHCR